jgi:hypothetical protein
MVWGLGNKVEVEAPEDARVARLGAAVKALGAAVTILDVAFADVLEAMAGVPAGTQLGREDAERVERVRAFLGLPDESAQARERSIRRSRTPAADIDNQRLAVTEALRNPVALTPESGSGLRLPFVPSGRA